MIVNLFDFLQVYLERFNRIRKFIPRILNIILKGKNYRVRIAVPLAELILIPTGIGVCLDLRYLDECIPTVPRFDEIMVFVGSEAMCSS